MTSSIPSIPNNKTLQEQVKILLGFVQQLSKKLDESEARIAKLQSVVDPEIKTRRLFDLLRSINSHTGPMPDMSGYNTDHDRRYLIRGSNISVPGTYFEENGKKLWWTGVEDGDLVTRFDVNLGVGTPDFANGEKVRYHPNND